MKCAFRLCFSALALLLTTTFVFAADDAKKETKSGDPAKKPEAAEKKIEKKEERKPSEGATKPERKPGEGTPRGERKPGEERRPQGGDGRRSEFPAEVKLTEDQEKKLAELRTEFGGKFSELSQKRDAILSDEQKTARTEVEKKLREGGVGRQEYADAMAAALKLTPEQKTKTDAVEAEASALRKEMETKRMAILTDAQKAELRKLMAAREIDRTFQMPAEFNLTDEQKKGLKALQDEHAAELKTLTEKRDAIMTDERKAAAQAVYKQGQDGKLDREAMRAALDEALKLSEAEKTELQETQHKLGELSRKVFDAKLALLTAEQKAEFEKKFGSRR